MHRYVTDEATALLNHLGVAPAYIVDRTDQFRRLSDAENRLINFFGSDAKAFTFTVADVMFNKHYLRYDWCGRGCCIVLCTSPMLMTEPEAMGLILHEAAHWINAFDEPARDDPDMSRAVKTFWNSMKRQSHDEQHGERWRSAAMHMWHRSCKLGYEIPLTDVIAQHHCKFTPANLQPLLDEAEQHEGEPIESLLRSHSSNPKEPTAPQKSPTAPKEHPTLRLKRLGLPRSFSAWIDGHEVEIKYGICTVDGSEVRDEEMQAWYRKWKYGDYSHTIPRTAAFLST